MKGMNYMKFSEALPETTKLWATIQEKIDTSKLNIEKRELEQRIEDSPRSKAQAKTLKEYKEIEQQILESEERILYLDNELNMSRFKYQEAIEEDVPKLLPAFNKEFKPFYNEYKNLQKELDSKLKSFAKEVEPTVERMIEIENVESQAHMLKIFGSQNCYSQYLKLPIDTNTLERPYHFLNKMISTLTASVKQIIHEIKKRK